MEQENKNPKESKKEGKIVLYIYMATMVCLAIAISGQMFIGDTTRALSVGNFFLSAFFSILFGCLVTFCLFVYTPDIFEFIGRVYLKIKAICSKINENPVLNLWNISMVILGIALLVAGLRHFITGTKEIITKVNERKVQMMLWEGEYKMRNDIVNEIFDTMTARIRAAQACCKSQGMEAVMNIHDGELKLHCE